MNIYPMDPTHTEELNAFIERSRPAEDIPDSSFIRKMIDNHDTSKMEEGVRYYSNQNDIKKRKRSVYKDGRFVPDKDGVKPNKRIPHNWNRLFVDQKSQYIVGKAITFSTSNETFDQLIDDLTSEQFDDMMNEMVKNVSNKGIEWLHPFVNEEGEFDYVMFPAEQVIPIFDQSKQKKLEYAIRYYPIYDSEGNETLKVELYTAREVFFYIEHEGEFIMDMAEVDDEQGLENPASHFYLDDVGYPWGRVPLIPFRNNEEEENDLTFYKELIDEYDSNVSDNANAFEEMRRLIYVLRGYDGENADEFISKLLYYGMVMVDGENAGVDTITPEIDMEASDTHLNRLTEDLYSFGQAVNTKTDKFGHSPSGVALDFLYSLLDLKANHIERKFRYGLQQFFWFFTEYLAITGQGEYDPNDVEMTFNRSKVTNQEEITKMAKDSKGVISDQTIRENHPWNTDNQLEEERMEKQKEEEAQMIGSMQIMGGDPNEPGNPGRSDGQSY